MTTAHLADGSKLHLFESEAEEACYHFSALFWNLEADASRRARYAAGDFEPMEWERVVQELVGGLN